MLIPHPIRHKLLYSKHQVERLDTQIARYLDEKSDEMLIEEYRDLDSFRSVLEGKEVSPIISLMCGDVIQNIRSVLDYLVWELVKANNCTPDEGNAFPVCKTPSTFREAQKRRLRGVHPDAIATIESLQHYHFGQGNESDSLVFVLDKLANINKHRTILMARERHAPVEMIRVTDSSGTGFDPRLASDSQATARFIKTAFEKKMNLQMAVFVEFGEYPAKDLEVVSVVASLYEGVALDIVPRFNRFFV